MDIDLVLIESSPAANHHKPVGKGRKKKSALTKLAEKKRLNSDGCSECGSTASLKKQEETNHTETKEKDIQQANHKETGLFQNDSVKEVNLIKKKGSEASKGDSVTDIKDSEVQNKVPKPKPRKHIAKTNKQKEEEILDSLEGGTVVSIYDKVGKTPTDGEKKELYTKLKNKVHYTSDGGEKQINRKLFPPEKKQDSGLLYSGPVKSRPGLFPLDDGDADSCKLKNVKQINPVPMDIDDDLDIDKEIKNSDYMSNNAPSDATVHRFRALRMTPDRCKSEESLKNINFIPKPPATPRSGRRASKGEKRNREANSSGEEPDNDAKKQISGKKASDEANLNVSNNNNVKHIDSSDINDNVDNSELDSAKFIQKPGLSIHPDAYIYSGIEASPDLTSKITSGENNAQTEVSSNLQAEVSHTNNVKLKGKTMIGSTDEPDRVPSAEKKNEKRKSFKIKIKKKKNDLKQRDSSEDKGPRPDQINPSGSGKDKLDPEPMEVSENTASTSLISIAKLDLKPLKVSEKNLSSSDLTSGENNVQTEVPPINMTELKEETMIEKAESDNIAKETDQVPHVKTSEDMNVSKKEKQKLELGLNESTLHPKPMSISEGISPSKTSIGSIGSASDLKAYSIGSASDLKAVVENYQQVLKADMSSNKYSEVYPGSLAKQTPGRDTSKIPETSPGKGRLSPIQPKNLPPPLPEDMKSTALRTTYKTDPSYTMNKYFRRALSGSTEKEKLHSDTWSQRSFGATTVLHPLSTREARDRMKMGNIGASLLSSSELDKYFPDRKVGLWVGSWNMAEMKECTAPLDDFLLPESSEYVQDIYAIGTQENAMSKKEWEILIQETIGPSHVLFHSTSLGALHLAIFMKRDLIWFCTVPEDDMVQTRAVTMVKTKGAIAVCFNFFGTSFLFVNAHLAPGDHRKKDRIDDYYKIIKQLNLPKTGNTSSPGGSSQDVTTRFDCVFWMGDLNFRIEVYKGKQAVEDIVQYVQEQDHPNFEDLVEGDQLTKLIVEGNIFQGFQEGRINFRPTYKYDIGKYTFDTSAKNRIPSYTDRVLFRARKKNAIACTHYDSPINIKVSDHRPVFALFEAAIQPARECTHQLAAGQFDRAVFTEASKRLSMRVDVAKKLVRREKSSTVCSIQ